MQLRPVNEVNFMFDAQAIGITDEAVVLFAKELVAKAGIDCNSFDTRDDALEVFKHMALLARLNPVMTMSESLDQDPEPEELDSVLKRLEDI